jgi:two-component system, NarL family, sensor histidine kinase UhpB
MIYLVFSITWILLSDSLVARISHEDSSTIERLQSVKGLIFVVTSGLLLYFTSRKIYKSLSRALTRKKELFKKLMALNKATREGIVDYNCSTDTAHINEAMKLMLNTKTFVVENFAELSIQHIHPEDRKRVIENFDNFREGKGSIWQTEYRYLVADGTYKDVICRGYLIRDNKTGKPLNFIYSLHDVTEIRDAKARFYEQRIQFRQSLSKSIIEAQEREKDRWAQELHDNVCQVLTVAKLYLEQATAEHGKSLAIEKSSSMIVTALNNIRQISSSIKPPEFSNTTLQESIQCLIENIKRFRKFDFEMCVKAEQSLNSEQKLMVYRVVQEQLNNIIKYADAKKVLVRIDVKDDHAFLHVKDDGNGLTLTM